MEKSLYRFMFAAAAGLSLLTGYYLHRTDQLYLGCQMAIERSDGATVRIDIGRNRDSTQHPDYGIFASSNLFRVELLLYEPLSLEKSLQEQ
jgi:hypothetical protein